MEDYSTIDLAYFSELDSSNMTCVDCRNEQPLYASINHGILLCRYCAVKHQNLGYNISYIREIANEWDCYLLSFIQRGGNERFIRFCNDYQLTLLPIPKKYCTKAAEYYRKLILSEVIAESPPELIKRNESLCLCEKKMLFPEFEMYKPFKGDKDNMNVKRNIFVKSGAYIYKAIKNSGGFIYKQSKAVVSYVARQSVNGLGYVYNRIASTNEGQTSNGTNDVMSEEKKTENYFNSQAIDNNKYSIKDVYQNENNPYPKWSDYARDSNIPINQNNHKDYNEYIKNKYSNPQLFYQNYHNYTQPANKTTNENCNTDIRQSNPSIIDQEHTLDNQYDETPKIKSKKESIITIGDDEHIKDNDYSITPQPLNDSELIDNNNQKSDNQ